LFRPRGVLLGAKVFNILKEPLKELHLMIGSWPGAKTFSITTLSMITFDITTLGMMGLFATLSIIDA
jgi:hypothetical protein